MWKEQALRLAVGIMQPIRAWIALKDTVLLGVMGTVNGILHSLFVLTKQQQTQQQQHAQVVSGNAIMENALRTIFGSTEIMIVAT